MFLISLEGFFASVFPPQVGRSHSYTLYSVETAPFHLAPAAVGANPVPHCCGMSKPVFELESGRRWETKLLVLLAAWLWVHDTAHTRSLFAEANSYGRSAIWGRPMLKFEIELH